MYNQDGEMKKMKFSDEKKKAQLKKKSPQRPSIVSNYSFVSLSEVTEGSLQVWRTLPEKIRQDPSLASFRQEHERLHGKFHIYSLFLNLKRISIFDDGILIWYFEFNPPFKRGQNQQPVKENFSSSLTTIFNPRRISLLVV